MAEVKILQACSKQKSAYGTEIEIENATGNLLSLNLSGATNISGTGDASPDNVWQIFGVNKATVNGTDYLLPISLYSLPNGIKDNYDPISGTGTQNIRSSPISAATWTVNSTYFNSNLVGFIYSPSDRKTGAPIYYCDSLPIQATGTPAKDKETLWYGNSVGIAIFKSRLIGWSDSLTDAQKIALFTAWISANPTTAFYQLATSVQITGTPQTIPTAEYTAITNDGGGQMSVSYIAKYEAVAKTNKAFGAKTVKELMRGYTLDFSVTNYDNARKYLIPGCVMQAAGQKFDISSFKQSSGFTNKTDVSGWHVSYRLSNYPIPVGYSFVGTAQQIAQDILNVSGASTEFMVGTCANVSGSFLLGNTQVSTARAALFAMKSLGVEADFDNFTVNLPTQCGTGNTKTFEFGKDLVSIDRTWDKDNGTNYDAKIVDLQQIPGHSEDVFDVGDYCIIKDKFIGDEIQKRIISYTTYLDSPEENSISIGVFVRDFTDDSIAMQINITKAQSSADKAQETADGSVQQNAEYSNVSVSHEKGFYAELTDGTYSQINGSGVKSTRTDGSYSLQDGTGFKNVAPDGSFMLMNAKGLTHHTGGTTDVENDYHYLSQSGSLTSVFTDDDDFTDVIITLNPEFIGKNINISLMVSDVYVNKPTGSTAAYATIRQYKCVIAGIENTTGRFLLLAALEGFSSKGELTQLGGMTINWIAIA